MDEERRVSERLERIEALQRGTPSGATLLAELRGLLEDGEAFFAAEAAGRVRDRLCPGADARSRRQKGGGSAEGVTWASI
jgi:hypothetical protein